MTNGIEVVVVGVSKVAKVENINLIVLLDKKNKRQLSVLCDEDLYHQIYRRMSHGRLDWSNSYPELFSILLRSCEQKFEIDIYGMKQGLYQASLIDAKTGVSYPVKCSHGVFMAFVMGMPIYVDTDLMDKMGVPFQSGIAKASLPISVIPEELIKKSMSEAIATENYELASELRDELIKRSGKNPHGKS